MNKLEKISTETSQYKFEDWFKKFLGKIHPYTHQLWQIKSKLLIINGIITCITLLYLFLLTQPYYESTITILPEFGSKSSILSGFSQLATLVGVRSSEGAPAEIYQNLITSESVLEEVIYFQYKTKKFDKPVTLIEYFASEISDEDKNDQRKVFLNIYKKISRNLTQTNIDRLTKILSVTVTMPESKLAADVANQMTQALDNYVKLKRKTFASEQRFYIEKRIMQLSDSLILAEEKLRDFSDQNRLILQSPQLLLEKGRLMRNVEILNAVYIELTKQLEVTKIDEIKETPIINVKEYAKDPVYKAGPSRLKDLLTILVLSFFFSSSYFLFKDRFIYYIRLVIRK